MKKCICESAYYRMARARIHCKNIPEIAGVWPIIVFTKKNIKTFKRGVDETTSLVVLCMQEKRLPNREIRNFFW